MKNGLQYIIDGIDTCVKLESKVLVGPIYSAVNRARLETEEAKKEQWQTVVSNLKEICKYAEEKGVYIGLEPINRFETDFINITQDGLKIINDVGNKMLKLNLDTFHMHIEEKNILQALIEAGKSLILLHASENDRGTPGTGQVHWDSIAYALDKINYDSFVIIEAFTPFVKEIAEAEGIWRHTVADIDSLAEDGLRFLKNLLAIKN